MDDESAGFTGVPIFLCGVQVALRIFNLFLSHVKCAYKCFPVCFLLAQRAIGCCAVRELEVARAWLLGCYYRANVPGGRLSIYLSGGLRGELTIYVLSEKGVNGDKIKMTGNRDREMKNEIKTTQDREVKFKKKISRIETLAGH